MALKHMLQELFEPPPKTGTGCKALGQGGFFGRGRGTQLEGLATGERIFNLREGQVGDGEIFWEGAFFYIISTQADRLFLDLIDGILEVSQIVHQHQAIGGQVIQDAGGGGVQVGDEKLRQDDLSAGGVPGKLKVLPAGQVLSCGGDRNPLDGADGALGGRLKAANGVDFIAEELQADGGLFGGGPDV